MEGYYEQTISHMGVNGSVLATVKRRQKDSPVSVNLGDLLPDSDGPLCLSFGVVRTLAAAGARRGHGADGDLLWHSVPFLLLQLPGGRVLQRRLGFVRGDTHVRRRSNHRRRLEGCGIAAPVDCRLGVGRRDGR